MTHQERDEALGFLMIVSFGIVIYLGIDSDWAWYGTALACIGVFFAWGTVLVLIERLLPKPLTTNNTQMIERLRERQHRMRQGSRTI